MRNRNLSLALLCGGRSEVERLLLPWSSLIHGLNRCDTIYRRFNNNCAVYTKYPDYPNVLTSANQQMRSTGNGSSRDR